MTTPLNTPVKIYFNDFVRSPIVGQFVELSDSKQLATKKMIRFVSLANYELFEQTGHVMHTRIFEVKSFKHVDII